MKNLFWIGLIGLFSSAVVAADATAGEESRSENSTVRVLQITGTNSEGERHELFRDRSGLLVAPEGLVSLDQIIKSKRLHQKGHYTAIEVELADEVFRYTTGGQVTRSSLQEAGLSRSIELAVDWVFPQENLVMAEK